MLGWGKSWGILFDLFSGGAFNGLLVCSAQPSHCNFRNARQVDGECHFFETKDLWWFKILICGEFASCQDMDYHAWSTHNLFPWKATSFWCTTCNLLEFISAWIHDRTQMWCAEAWNARISWHGYVRIWGCGSVAACGGLVDAKEVIWWVDLWSWKKEKHVLAVRIPENYASGSLGERVGERAHRIYRGRSLPSNDCCRCMTQNIMDLWKLILWFFFHLSKVSLRPPSRTRWQRRNQCRRWYAAP